MKSMFSKMPEFDSHEFVVFIADAKTGLQGFIAIHNTNLGPAAGGTRYWKYSSDEEALGDALKLSRAMTYKCALAGVPYGGGKAVIMAERRNHKSPALIRAYAKKVNFLGGNFYTGEDVGIEEKDIQIMTHESKFIVGRPRGAGALGPWAALGVFSAMQAALEELYGNISMRGRSFAVKGLGKVGGELARRIAAEGGRVIGADIDSRAVNLARRKAQGIEIVSPEDIHRKKVDVFAPCALDGDLNRTTINQLNCDIVCGAANNQLVTPEDGERLHKLGILYVPDYLANAGGLINVVGELDPKGYSRRRVQKRVRGIRKTARKIIELSRKSRKPTSEVADALAEEIFLHKKQ